MLRPAGIILLCLALFWGPAGTSLAAPAAPLEDLQYRVSLGFWGEVALVHLQLTRLGPDRYRARFIGAARGAGKLLSRLLPEHYETEMLLESGRLKPLVYKEEFQAKAGRVVKEYRFDYTRRILEVWRGVDGAELKKSWQAPLKEPLYDPLTLFYDLRLEALGPLAGGQSLKIMAIPEPDPREMVIDAGLQTARGRKVMITTRPTAPGAGSSQFFLYCNPRWVPLEVWFRVMSLVKLSGKLTNPEGIVPDLPAALAGGN